MRYYFMNSEMKDFHLDVVMKSSSDAIKSFEFTHETGKKTIFVKSLGGKNYYSFDQVKWAKLTALGVNESLVSNSETYKVFRGFKPSGLHAGGAGALITQMPGKVVKIMVKEGESVTKGQTVLILEAMKMENEIKCGVDGKVKIINVKEGQALEAGTLMIEVEE